MTDYMTSPDGTRIAFDRVGEGPPLVLVGGMFCDRRTLGDLADQLAQDFTVINYDRRGRGWSGDTHPYSVQREVEDIGALIDHVGGAAAVYGHSSGAALALQTALARLPVTRLILHEPPYSADDMLSRKAARELATTIRMAIEEDRRYDAIKAFFADQEMPPEVLDGMACDLGMQAVAPTMVYDMEIMGCDNGGGIPERFVRDLWVPTLVIAGSDSGDFFMETAKRLVEVLPDGQLAVLEGATHAAPADVVAPVVVDFLTGGLASAGCCFARSYSPAEVR